jgi:hypothetical protein
MKRKFFSLLILNTIVIAFLISTVDFASAQKAPEKTWWDDWVPCEWIGPGYYEHECHPNGQYIVCVSAPCTLTIID